MTTAETTSAAPAPSLADFVAGTARLKGFKVYEFAHTVNPVPTYQRRDFYKICLITGRSVIHYADRSLELDGTHLFFANPHIPYATEQRSALQTGHACLFTEEFVKGHDRSESLQQSPLFKIGGTPLFKLSDADAAYSRDVFQRMLAAQETDYLFKDELFRTYLHVLVHQALSLQPDENSLPPKNASLRIASLFLDLLERLFPIENPQQALSLRSAQDFANQLAVHVNHLNKSVKEITGKSTTVHIAERVLSEAKALLRHTDWDITHIATSLGFSYVTYFANFFKKHTGTTPLAFRKAG